MNNFFTLVGRLTHIKKDFLIIKTIRGYKNADGIYEEDHFNVYASENIMENTAKYCKVGDVIGAKGRMESKEYVSDGKTFRQLMLIADKISYLASGSTPISGTKDIEDGADSDEEQYSH